MHILLIVVGGLLAAFGGGCTLIMFGLGISDPSGVFNDVALLLEILLPLGILPLVAGLFLIRWGVRIDRQRRAALAAAKNTDTPPPSEAGS